MTNKQVDSLIAVLRDRFEQNMNRHEGIDWSDVEARPGVKPEKLKALHEMERTGGRSSAFAVTTRCSSITTAPSRTMRRGVFAA